MIESATIVLLFGVLLGGNAALGLAGVAAHHGLVAMPTVWSVGLIAMGLRRVLLWRLPHRGDSPKPSWKTALTRATLGSSKAVLFALLTPVAGYLWADAVHTIPAPVRWLVPALLLGFAGWRLHRRGLRWPLQHQHQERLRAALASPWLGHVAWILLGLVWTAPKHSIDELIAEAAERSGIRADVSSFRWIDEPYRGIRTAFTTARGVLLISRSDVPNDVFVVHVALTHDGEPARLVGAYNLSSTASVEEAGLTTWRKWAAWKIVHEGKLRSIELADLSGEGNRDSGKWPALSRAQRALTNRQVTGQWRGVGRSSVIVSDEPATVPVSLRDGKLIAGLSKRKLELDLGRTPSAEALGSTITFQANPPPRPGALVPWAVDRLRAVSWIGSERMQWVKGWVFRATEQLEELENQVVGIDPDETVTEELGDLLVSLPLAQPGEVPGWPPAPVEPLMKPALTGEGRWVSLAQDLLAASPGLPSPFVFTFVRTDSERAYIQTSITLWDPRRVQLHILAGTEEPKSMTGEVGTGTIPRDPKVLRRLVGAFNGAFQAVHGEFGMMESRRLQLPPKPYAATVATYPDGTAGFGTWPLSAAIPKEMVSMRQNLTPLVANGKLNPYRRTWWGGVPEGWTEETRTVRSGLCLTEEGFLAYFYSPGITPEDLGKAMLQTRCTYGLHLDMNAGHTGFEFYRVAPEGELPTLDRPLDRMWEAKGQVTDVEGLYFFSRLMVRKMPLMNFPRYIHPTSRDFFYLTQRPLLPGPALEPLLEEAEDDGQWRIAELGGPVFPPALALTRLRLPAPGAKQPKAYVLTRFDPKELYPTPPKGAQAVLEAPAQDELGLWLQDSHASVSADAPSPTAELLARGSGELTTTTNSGLCVDHDGMVLLLRPELDAGAAEKGVKRLAEHAGCAQTIYLATTPSFRFGETLEQAREQESAEGVRRTWFTRRAYTGVRHIFEDTPILAPEEWALVQRRRVQYDGSQER